MSDLVKSSFFREKKSRKGFLGRKKSLGDKRIFFQCRISKTFYELNSLQEGDMRVSNMKRVVLLVPEKIQKK